MTDIVDDSYQKLVNAAYNTDPRLGDLLVKKYEEDREEFMEAIKVEISTRANTSWAKASCKKCYGSGIIGTRSLENVYCSCVNKGFLKWIPTFRKSFLEKKGQNA